jgi:hypothetical protein
MKRICNNICKLFKKRPEEDILRSFSVVDLILEESGDFGVTTHTVTNALIIMKQNPTLTISEAIIAGYEKCIS